MLAKALKLMDIRLADHIVVADTDWVSMYDSGMIREIY
jgi:DNA repair protein RadC